MKICNSCGDALENSEFYREPDGSLRYICKRCHLLRVQEWQKAHPDKVRVYQGRHNERRKEARRAYDARYWKKVRKPRIALMSACGIAKPPPDR
jgi:hypothetical protein